MTAYVINHPLYLQNYRELDRNMVYICDMQLYSSRHSHLDMMVLCSIRDNSTPMVNMLRSMLEDTRFTVDEGERETIENSVSTCVQRQQSKKANNISKSSSLYMNTLDSKQYRELS